jgi:hypothetical protein
MAKVKITKLSGKTIRIERASHIPGRDPIIQDFAAQFHATGNENLNTVTVNTDKTPFCSITAAPSEFEINGEVPASVEEATALLNGFIGNFENGGSVSDETLALLLDLLVKSVSYAADPNRFLVVQAIVVSGGTGCSVGQEITLNGVVFIVQETDGGAVVRLTPGSYDHVYDTDVSGNFSGDNGLEVIIRTVNAPGNEYMLGELQFVAASDPLTQRSTVLKMIQQALSSAVSYLTAAQYICADSDGLAALAGILGAGNTGTVLVLSDAASGGFPAKYLWDGTAATRQVQFDDKPVNGTLVTWKQGRYNVIAGETGLIASAGSAIYSAMESAWDISPDAAGAVFREVSQIPETNAMEEGIFYYTSTVPE